MLLGFIVSRKGAKNATQRRQASARRGELCAVAWKLFPVRFGANQLFSFEKKDSRQAQGFAKSESLASFGFAS